MTPEHWQRVKDVLTQVLQASEPDRPALLDAACGNDAGLRGEVLSLLEEMESEDATTVGDDDLRRSVLAMARALTPAQQQDDAEQLRATLQTSLYDTYELLSTLGVGGMGTVFLARERALDRYVAIKTLRREHAVTAHSRERFRREARIAAQLSHPGILPLLAFGEVSGLWYLVMGYVRGPTLAQRIHAEGRLHADQALQIMRGVSDALEHAHQRQVIHRDIKPANILIDDESGRPLLADFGISKAVGHGDTLTQSGDVLGTPHYMAPEQIRNAQDCDVRSDIYSLGAVAYAMLTGHAPFSTVQGSELTARYAQADVPSFLTIDATVPRDLVAVVSRCLNPTPANRFQSARQLRDALDRVDRSAEVSFAPELREVAGFGAYAFAWFVLWTAMAFTLVAVDQRWPFLVLALLVPIGLALQVSRSLQPSTNWRQLVRVAFWPPLWWGMWWPAALRRPDDVWNRLPWTARALRVVLSTCILSLPILVVAGRTLGLVNDDGFATAGWNMTFGVLAGAALMSLAGAVLATRKLNLQRGDAMQFLVGPTAASPFWRQQDILRALRFDAPGVRPPSVDLPSDYVRAMEDLRRHCTEASASALELPIIMARRSVHAIASLSREIAILERDASPHETARVASRLSELSDRAPHARDDRQALIALVQSELEILRRMDQRRMLALNEQAALLANLRALWAEMLRTASSSGAAPVPASQLTELMEQGASLLARQSPATPL